MTIKERMETLTVDPTLLIPNGWNSNTVGFENMQKLKNSISELGFASAVVVRELSDGSLEILGGHHRVQAAVELGLEEVPILNLGRISDAHAKKIGLVDNSRYGVDDTISLAEIYEDLGLTNEQLAEFLPYTEIDFDTVKRSIEIDVDALDIDIPDEPIDPEKVSNRVEKTHDILKFRMTLGNAERIRKLVEKAMKKHGFDDADEMTAAGEALSLLLLGEDEDEED